MKTKVKKVGRVARATAGVTALFFFAVALFAVSQLARADDIQISATVVESTPTATPADFVKLQTGENVTTAPLVSVQIVGLEPFSFVQVFAQSEPILIASGFADKYGIFKCQAQLPTTLEPGSHTITAITQDKGEAAASVKSLAKFSVSDSGIVNASKDNGGTGTGSNNGSGGGSSGSPSPTASGGGVPTDIVKGESYGGILVVGGYDVFSPATWAMDGSKAKLRMTFENSYSKPYSLKASFRVRNFLGLEIAKSKTEIVSNLKSKETRTIQLETAENIGQWGAYAAEVTIVPPKKVDSYQLQEINRAKDFFVWPTIPGSIIAISMTIAVLMRIFWVRLSLRLRMPRRRSGDRSEE